jgi:hypothetical protein
MDGGGILVDAVEKQRGTRRCSCFGDSLQRGDSGDVTRIGVVEKPGYAFGQGFPGVRSIVTRE